jgi:hypothetical protein
MVNWMREGEMEKSNHAASTRGQSVLHDLTFRLMDSLVPNGRIIVNSKQMRERVHHN